MSLRLFVSMIMLVFLFKTAPAQSSYPYPLDSVHPNFELPNIEDGSPVALSDHRGKKILLVHFASW